MSRVSHCRPILWWPLIRHRTATVVLIPAALLMRRTSPRMNPPHRLYVIPSLSACSSQTMGLGCNHVVLYFCCSFIVSIRRQHSANYRRTKKLVDSLWCVIKTNHYTRLAGVTLFRMQPSEACVVRPLWKFYRVDEFDKFIREDSIRLS